MKSSLKNLVNISMVLLGASPALPVMRRRYLPIINDPSFHRVLSTVNGGPFCFYSSRGRRGKDEWWVGGLARAMGIFSQ